MKTEFLSLHERETGAKSFLTFTFFNGMGFGFLADTVVFLLAIHFGASNLALGYIASLINLSGVILILTPKLLSGKNMVKVYFWTWLFRGLVCLINAVTLFVSNQIAVAVILISYTLFCSVRIIGVTLYNPMLQMTSTPSTLGHLITSNHARFNLGNILGKVISFLIVSISFLKGLIGLLILQALGVILNSFATLFLRKIPCREKIELSKQANVFSLLFKNISKKKQAIPLLIHWNFLSISVLFGFSIPLLKKVVGLDQNLIFLYTISVALFATFSMYSAKPFIDKVAAKPVIIITAAFDVLFFIFWAFVKKSTPVYLIFTLGSISVFIKGFAQAIIGRTLISSIPQNEKISYNTMVTFFAAFLAFCFGMLTGAIADIGEKFHPEFLNRYYLIFLTAAFFSGVNILLSLNIEDKNRTAFKDTAEFFLSLRNIKAIFDVYNLEMATDSQKRQHILMSLKYNSTAYVTNEIKKILKNPLSHETEEVLKSLFTKPRPKILPDILEIAEDKGSYHRASAIFALGSYPEQRVEQSLIKMLDDPNITIRSTAAKSLARIGNKNHYRSVLELMKNRKNSGWDIMNYLIALSFMDPHGKYLQDLFEISDYQPHKKYKQSIFSLESRLLNFSPQLNLIYQKENIEKHCGIKMLLDEARQIEPFYKNYSIILENFKTGNFETVWKWIKRTLKNHKHIEPYIFLYKGLLKYPLVKINQTNTIAALYFAFMILSNEYEEE